MSLQLPHRRPGRFTTPARPFAGKLPFLFLLARRKKKCKITAYRESVLPRESILLTGVAADLPEMLPPVTFVLATRNRRRSKSGCVALTFKKKKKKLPLFPTSFLLSSPSFLHLLSQILRSIFPLFSLFCFSNLSFLSFSSFLTSEKKKERKRKQKKLPEMVGHVDSAF